MVKYLATGVVAVAATALPAGFTWWWARAQSRPLVPVQCPQTPDWMQVQWNNQRLWAYGNQVRK